MSKNVYYDRYVSAMKKSYKIIYIPFYEAFKIMDRYDLKRVKAYYFDKDYNIQMIQGYENIINTIGNVYLYNYDDGTQEVRTKMAYQIMESNIDRNTVHNYDSVFSSMLISRLKVGNNIRDIHGMIKNYEARKPEEDTEIIENFTRFNIYTRGGNGKTSFDYIIVEITCTQRVDTNMVKKLKNKLDKEVIKRLKKDKKFLKFGIPINCLRVSNLVLTIDKVLVYTLELKKELIEN